jgi:hypothetical protein
MTVNGVQAQRLGELSSMGGTGVRGVARRASKFWLSSDE